MQGMANFGRVAGRHQPVGERSQGVAVLLHGEQRHVVGSRIAEPHRVLRPADRVGEWSAARHQDHMAGAGRDRRQPILEGRREGEAPAQLDDGQRRLRIQRPAFGSLSPAATG